MVAAVALHRAKDAVAANNRKPDAVTVGVVRGRHDLGPHIGTDCTPRNRLTMAAHPGGKILSAFALVTALIRTVPT